jgi:26S proteasome regulatory subunit N5|eukprot:CAMPEP_0169108388 /NCGR_PEP_ID=MMETSP1015-20121227/25402_1 /TAXON_ID=342587 /ORGANISM="Karlodinium micrum, Strain CCMP2283" /LENGTH=458 /DNA_ID=CAMNT_0009170009 /DNA_START=73 /DNA_END=1449 /DNA_ORIENTATION=+
MADNINPVLGNLAKDPKAVEDFSKDTEEVLARSDTMAKAGRLEEAVEDILALEKKTRQGYDAISTSKLICCICKLYFDANDWAKLREYIVLLAKKRGQLKRAITDMVHLAMGWLDGLGKDKKIELIQTLSEVTDGKIFVEVEKARLTKILAEMKEEEGDTDEAANLLQEVQVETFGAMDKMEKTTYILEQLRLVLLKKDYVRAQIISRKINPKLLEADDMQELKLRYNEYMVKFWLHEKKILDVSKCYLSMFNTKIVQEDEEKWKPALTAHVLYLTLSMYDNEQSDMLNKLDTMETKKLEKVPVFQTLVKIFIRQELATWPLADEKELKAHAVFQDQPHEGGAARWEMFRKRLNQHNIKVVSKYYDQIQTPRLCELLGLSDKETEEELSELVCGKFVHAKIDRPAGTIKFGQKANYTDTLNNWGGSISKMLDLVENTCHLIQKEQMVHAARAKLKAKK